MEKFKYTTYPDGTYCIDGIIDASVQKIVIPEGVSVIGCEAFRNHKCLKEIVLPSTLREISPFAFEGTSLTSISLPENLQEIGIGAFQACPLKNLVFPNNLQKIGSAAFSDCSLESVCLPSSLREIEPYTFNNCLSLVKISIPKSIEKIGKYAFARTSISFVYLPDSIRQIDAYAFNDLLGWDGSFVSLPDKSIIIHPSAFSPDTKINRRNKDVQSAVPTPASKTKSKKSTVSIAHKTVQEVSKSPWDLLEYKKKSDGTYLITKTKNKKIKSIEIPEGVSEISDRAFNTCENLKSVTFPSTLKEIGKYAFGDCHNLESVVLPSSLEKIESWAFHCCFKLRDIVIPQKVKKINSYVFSSCKSLSCVVLSNGVLSIEQGAFSGCDALKSVTFGENLQQISKSAFSLCGTAPVSVIFKNPRGWKHNGFSLLPCNWETVFSDKQKAATAIRKHCSKIGDKGIAFERKETKE